MLFTHLLCLCRVVGIVCTPFSLLQLLIWASFIHFKERLPEAICCCLQTCNVDVVLLVMYRMYIPALIVTSADIKPVMGIFMLLTHILPEAICCCLQTCNVYGAWVLHMCTNFRGHLC